MDFKTSTGWWRGDDNIVDEWNYVDMQGNCMSGVDCRKEYEEYKANNNFYQTLKD